MSTKPTVTVQNVVFGDGPEDNVDVVVLSIPMNRNPELGRGSLFSMQILSLDDFLHISQDSKPEEQSGFVDMPAVWGSETALESVALNCQAMSRLGSKTPSEHMPAFERPPVEEGLYKACFDMNEVHSPYNTINS